MKQISSHRSVRLKCARPGQHLPHAVFRRRSPSATVTTGRHPCKESFQKIPGCCREGVRQAKLHLPALMINTDKRHRVWLKQMGDISRRDKCREWLNQKKSTNTFKCTITRTVSLQSLSAEEIFIRHGRERKEANICELGMGRKSLLLLGFFF